MAALNKIASAWKRALFADWCPRKIYQHIMYICNIMQYHIRTSSPCEYYIYCFQYVQSVYYVINLDKTVLDAMEHQWNHVINYQRPWTKTQSRCCKAKLEEAKALLPFSLCVESTHQSCARDGVRNHQISPPEEWMNRQLPRIAFVTCIDGAR